MADATIHPWLYRLSDATDIRQCGGKAAGLALLARAGLPVPPAVVVTDAAFRAIVLPAREPPTSLEQPTNEHDAAGAAIAAWASYWSDLAQKLAHLAVAPSLLQDIMAQAAAWQHVAVRSSMALEDGANAAAPGLFVSQNHIEPTAPALADALRAVWISACTPMVGLYRARRDGNVGSFAIAAIVQQFIVGERLVIYTRPPGAPAEATALLQQAGTTRRLARTDAAEPALQLALAAEQAIDAPRGADVELLRQSDGTLWIVQARPIVHPPRNAERSAPPAGLLAAMHADGRTWILDRTHNPTPLSTAQAELVQAVQTAGVAPFAMRLCAGYLYATSARPAFDPGALPDRVLDNASNLTAYWATLCQKMAATLAGADASLNAVLQRYVAFYTVWSNQVAPIIKAARRRLHDEFAAQRTALDQQREIQRQIARPSSIDRQLQQCARGEMNEHELRTRIADVATQWDVAAPTYGEHWDAITQAVARLRSHPAARPRATHLPAASNVGGTDAAPAQSAGLQAALAIARLGADYAEQDDLWFFRAQAQVRRALLQRAAQLGFTDEQTDDIFWLPWSVLEDAAHFEPMQAHALARAARTAAQRATQWQMPHQIGGTLPSTPMASTAVGGGGAFAGTVLRLVPEALAQRWPDSNANNELNNGRARIVVVARALTPGLVLGLAGATGIVCDSGGFLDHGAAMARELGVPYLVGAHDVFDRCYDGQRIAVDPDTGTVTLHP